MSKKISPPELRRLAPLAVVSVAAILTGCFSSPVKVNRDSDPAISSLDKVLDRAKADLPAFTATSTAKAPEPKVKAEEISLDYAGEAKVLLSRLAAANKLKFSVTGPQPHLPLFVVVNAKGVELVDVMKDIGEQFGERADLVMTDKSVEVHYRGK